jgi:hypothetical protein
MIELDWTPDEKKLRQFGFIAFAGFGGLALLAYFEVLVFSFGLGQARPWVAGGLASLGGLAALFSLIHPRANLPIYVGLSVVAFPIGFVLSYLIMGTLFYLIITPVGLFFKLTGRDPLYRKFDPEVESYWVEASAERDRESYFKQF